MSAPHDRRGFLRGLAALPLVGGSVALIGQPSAVAEPVTGALLAQYRNWLFYERRLLCHEMADGDVALYRVLQSSYGGNIDGGREDLTSAFPEFHFPMPGKWTDVPKPSTRAALVMGAIDFDWRPVR